MAMMSVPNPDYFNHQLAEVRIRALLTLASRANIELDDLVAAVVDPLGGRASVDRSMMASSGASYRPQPSPLDELAARELTAVLMPHVERLKGTSSNAVKTKVRKAIDDILARHGYPTTVWRRKKDEA